MRVIFKYPYNNEISMPESAEVFYLGYQGNVLTMWAIVDTDSPNVNRRFSLYGTGWPIEDADLGYIGSVFDGPFVWHVFERYSPVA